MCPYCGIEKSALTKHLRTVHRDEEKVQEALNLNRSERLKAFENLKRMGIKMYNLEQTKLENPQYQRQRKSTTNNNKLIYCSECSITIAAASLARHRRTCKTSAFKVSVEAGVDVLPKVSEQFKKHVLATMHND